jgi:3-oxoacyl-[acyl-carrier protein] reductase
MNYDFSGRVALVTGAGRGIGRSVALRLAQAGARVAVVDRGEYLSAVEQEIKQGGGEAKALTADVADPGQVEGMVESVRREFGRIDYLVNNAGILRFAVFSKMAVEQWDEIINNNLRGCFLVTRAVLPAMRERGCGGIVNVSSLFAFDNVGGYSAYNASKAGIAALTVTLSREEARHNIRVNAVAPGAIDTPMNLPLKNDPRLMDKVLPLIPLRRLGKPEEVANAVAFLLSDEASYITGHVLWVTGGYRNPY